MKKVIIHADGGCEGNPGPGGWAAVLEAGDRTKEISGGSPATTNNRMELQAAIEALRALKRPCEVDFFTDSQYLRKGITEWMSGWKMKRWTTAGRKPVKNKDLWVALDALAAPHTIRWHWLRGHAGHELNERCDSLAAREIARVRQQYPAAELRRLAAELRDRQQSQPQQTLL